MSNTPQSDSSDRGEKPGKTRTLWHPLLARLLDYALSSAYAVQTEVLVGKMPLRVDILLVRREKGELSEAKRREVSALLPLLNRFTLIEFKGPTDSLERGDFAQLVGCAFLWHSQQAEPISDEDVSLVILAPTITRPLHDELRLFGCEASQREPGIFRVTGLPFQVWLVETDAMAQKAEPVLSLVSRIFLKNHESIIEVLTHAGHATLAGYVRQQVHQLHTHREDFDVQSGVTDEFAELDEKLKAEFLAVLTAEERLSGLPPEEVLRVVSPEELAAAMTAEQAARLREILDRKKN